MAKYTSKLTLSLPELIDPMDEDNSSDNESIESIESSESMDISEISEDEEIPNKLSKQQKKIANVIYEIQTIQPESNENYFLLTHPNGYYEIRTESYIKKTNKKYNNYYDQFTKKKITHQDLQNNYLQVTYLADKSNWILPIKDIDPFALQNFQLVSQHNNMLAQNIPLQSTTATNIKCGVIYARTSTKDDSSIQTQLSICSKYAIENHIMLLPFGCIIDENVSARNMYNMKKEFGFWLDYLPENSHIIIRTIDRFSRCLVKGMEVLESLKARNISVHFVTEDVVFSSKSGAAKLSFIYKHLNDSEMYSNMVSERVKQGIAKRKSQGLPSNHYAPYGYSFEKKGNTKKLIPNPKEQVIIKKIKSFHEKYIISLLTTNKKSKSNITEAVQDYCNKNNITGRNGKKFTIPQLEKIIASFNITSVSKNDSKTNPTSNIITLSNMEELNASSNISQDNISQDLFAKSQKILEVCDQLKSLYFTMTNQSQASNTIVKPGQLELIRKRKESSDITEDKTKKPKTKK